jgi:hypothetical protein
MGACHAYRFRPQKPSRMENINCHLSDGAKGTAQIKQVLTLSLPVQSFTNRRIMAVVNSGMSAPQNMYLVTQGLDLLVHAMHAVPASFS